MDELAALRLQMEWGADEALLDAPADRARATAPTPLRPPSRPPPAAPAPAAPPQADACTTLAELRAAMTAFDGCALRDTAGSLVFAEGEPGAAVLVVGDAPGADDDRAGRAMAGADGAYLDRMLCSIGLARADVMLTPLVPWRPPGGRPPSTAEIAQCLPFLHRLIVLARPRLIVALGALAARTLVGGGRTRAGGWGAVTLPGLPSPVPALTMVSPAALMRTPAKRREAWAQLRSLRRAMDGDIART